MGTRPLSPDEAALWARVMAGVRPMKAKRAIEPVATVAKPLVAPAPKPFVPNVVEAPARHRASPIVRATVPDMAPRLGAKRTESASSGPANTLDGTWDRQLSRGLVSPDRTIDLHGHTLHSAHDLLDAALDAAIRGGNRLILLITGKPPRPTSERPHARGAIRAATGDWLAGSRHASSIAAVRAAHPRHGGAGALYIILRKPRPQTAPSRKS